jgi:Peptidase_C39 like family
MKQFLLTLGLCSILQLPLRSQSNDDGLNSLLGFNLWTDSTLWDDKADFTARRLNLRGSINGATSFYRGVPRINATCLGTKLYALDLYGAEGYIQRVVLGFINRADMAGGLPGARSRLYDEAAKKDLNTIRNALIQRLGQPNQRNAGEVWPWVGHELILSQGSEAIILTIQKGSTAANLSADTLPQETIMSRNPPSYFVKRNGTGDVYIQGLPPISQGDRNYCVPASWEKVLRHLGLGLNVYDLAQKGGTKVDGTLFMPFAKEMENLLNPSNYQITYIRSTDNDFNAIQTYIDQGLPVIWGMNANSLRQWVARNSSRKEQLPPVRFSTSNYPPAPHAILIVGYNNNYKEVALSDSTDLGSSTPQIWISASEMIDAEFGSVPKIVVQPPRTANQNSGSVIRPRWY